MRDADNEDMPEMKGASPGAGSAAFEAGPDAAGVRLDQWLTQKLGSEFSRSRVQALIRQGVVTVGGKPVDDPGRKLKSGETVAIDLPEPEAAEPRGEDIPLDILYEDDDLIVIDKPAGLVVHPGAGNPTGTLVNALIHHCGDSLSGIGGVRRPGIVHRLDKETIGRHGRRQDRPRPSRAVGGLCRSRPLRASSNAPMWRWSGARPNAMPAWSMHRLAGRRTACAAPWCRPAAPMPAKRSPTTRSSKGSARCNPPPSLARRSRPLAGGASRMPPRDRQDAPDPRPHGPYRPPCGRRSRLWPGFPDQGEPLAGAACAR